MKAKNIFYGISILIVILLGILFFIYSFFNFDNNNIKNKVTAYNLSATELVNSYTNNEKKANLLYTGKIIEITGTIKEITFLNDRNTIILNSNSETFGVICDINPNQKEKIHQLKQHQIIKIKGICKGFLKDVIFLNCAIDLPINE